jgi:hypothetical protein
VVAVDVSLELGQPVARVLARSSSVERAAMPEAAVDEDGDPTPRENDVRTNPDPAGVDKVIDLVPRS